MSLLYALSQKCVHINFNSREINRASLGTANKSSYRHVTLKFFIYIEM